MKAPGLVLLVFLALGAALAGAASAQNIVTNGDFEGDWHAVTLVPGGNSIADGWTEWSVQLPPYNNKQGHPAFWELPGDNGIPDPTNNFQRVIGGAIKSENMRGGIYQVLDTVAGQTYDFSADLKWNVGPPKPQAHAYMGYETTPAATLDPIAATVVNTELEQTPNKEVWNHYVVRFTATSSQTAIIFRAEIPDPSATLWLDIDNVVVEPATAPPLSITDGPSVAQIDESTFRVTWQTDIPSDSTLQWTDGAQSSDFGLFYANSINDPALVTSHSVDITGLTLEKIIQYRVLSAAAGYRTVNSLNRSFSTPPPAIQFSNPSFETVIDADPGPGRLNQAPGWRKFWDAGDGRDPAWLDGIFGPDPTASMFFNLKPTDGHYFAGAVASQVAKNGGFYQRVVSQPGTVYTFNADFATLAGGGSDPTADQVWLGIDTNGGVDPEAATIVWSMDNFTNPAKWSRATVSAAATGNAITLFIRFYQRYPLPFNMTLADNTSLEFPVEVSSIGEARSLDNGAVVDITNDVVVSLVPVAETGFFYAQDEGRSGGIRVQAPPTGLQVGDRIKLKGLVLTDGTTGERYQSAATFTETAAGDGPVPVIVNNRDTGGAGYTGAYGLDSGGLLVKVYGQVTDSNFVDAFWVDDGAAVVSGVAVPGIKVIRSDQFPSVGDFVAVVGVVTSEIADGKKIRVLRGREAAFASDFETLNP